MPLQGIDISNWQAGIDLHAVPADFVIIKATEGLGYVSPSCDSQYQDAKSAWKLLAFYHYADGNDPVAEADFFIQNTLNYFHEAIPCLDWESARNARWGIDDAGWCRSFCDRVYERTGVHPIVYVQASALNRLEGQIGDCGMWVAQYATNDPTGYQDHPSNEGAYTCAIRQYSSAGSLAGYNGRLDLDLFYGDVEAWMKYANSSGDTPAPTPVETGFVVGDEVVPINLTDYNGTAVTSYHDSYIISELNGDRAVLTANGTIWCAMNTQCIQKVGSAPVPAPQTDNSIHVGDTVRPTSNHDYNGTQVTSWHDSYIVSELVGDRAVLTAEGVVWCAMNVNNIQKVG
jgi:GH25 family lysozyme M1 (1,4-beta-N-acetylmuramidase)